MTQEEQKKIIEEAGGQWIGYQPPFTLKSGKVIGDHVLFNSLQTGTTLVIKQAALTVAAVRAKLLSSNEQFQNKN